MTSWTFCGKYFQPLFGSLSFERNNRALLVWCLCLNVPLWTVTARYTFIFSFAAHLDLIGYSWCAILEALAASCQEVGRRLHRSARIQTCTCAQVLQNQNGELGTKASRSIKTYALVLEANPARLCPSLSPTDGACGWGPKPLCHIKMALSTWPWHGSMT